MTLLTNYFIILGFVFVLAAGLFVGFRAIELI
nr:cytochrome b6-f complex subunit 6 [Meringosphaera mediterranea]WLD05765.1 cytochrome b6-f complex subunit 6 [Meringosphaera mediterranea]WLD05825.1 cytochrome b6-f complex subunit 6 [Meringosphaera mediterranea]WLD06045.1 cytochrome b6-f complex subunit 6 [Meringosphaera mediterranea]